MVRIEQMIVYRELRQDQEMWEKIRLGKATASEGKKVITAGGEVSSSREPYMRQLARECVCDDPHAFTGNKHTDWGHEYEPEARGVFTDETGLPIETFGFTHRKDMIIGASPDGMHLEGRYVSDGSDYTSTDRDYGLEIKCPTVDVYVKTMMEGVLPIDHRVQVHWSMAATGLKAWYFMSYFPGLVPFIIKVEADKFTERVKAAQDDFVIDYASYKERVFDKILPSRQKPKLMDKRMIEDLI